MTFRKFLFLNYFYFNGYDNKLFTFYNLGTIISTIIDSQFSIK